MSKVGILTLGLKDNYGGILQAIALYCFLKKNGYHPILIRKYPIENSIKRIIRRALEILPFQNFRGIRISNLKYNQNLKFWSQYIDCQTVIFTRKREIETYINNNELSSIVVGSDQVWRYTYINDSEYDTYFLNFKLEKKIKKISYAASFGKGEWEAPDKVRDISGFLSKFSAVSVREMSGIDICNNTFGVKNSKLVLDPTLLMGREFFCDMIKDVNDQIYESVQYILDPSETKNSILNTIHNKYSNGNIKNILDGKNFYSLDEWVSFFKNTNFVVTDSFHGMVFSIIFNKQFIVLINNNRGRDRFESLCSLLGIKDRLWDINQNNYPTLEDIDYGLINEKLDELRRESANFLISSIEN